MSLSEFEQIGVAAFGTSRFGSQMAARTGLSTALISNIRTGKAQISDKTAAQIRGLVQQHAPTLVQEGDSTVSLADTETAGDRCFKLQLVATDLLSKRFVAVTEVNPALFFPKFAPAAPVVQQTLVQQIMRGAAAPAPAPANDADLSDDAILARITSRVSVMDQIASAVIEGTLPSLIAYGPAGIGKSHTIMKALADKQAVDRAFHYDVIKGSCSTPGLYQALYAARNGGVVLLDDSDNIFDDDETLNILKAALDSSETRTISYRKEAKWLAKLAAENGVEMCDVQDFTFSGGVIFITNVDLDARITAGHRMAPHYEALKSRSFYVNLAMDSARARALRVKSVFISGGMAQGLGLSETEAADVMAFITENQERLSEVSLRMATLITRVYKSNPTNWQEIIRVTKMR